MRYRTVAVVINCIGDAFLDERAEVYRLLTELAEDYIKGEVQPSHSLVDVNGNTCGEVKIFEIEG